MIMGPYEKDDLPEPRGIVTWNGGRIVKITDPKEQVPDEKKVEAK